MSIIRRAQGQEFTVLPNGTIRDTRLSLDALGLLVKLISRPPNWEVRPYQLQQECSIGRDKLRRLLAELENTGYLVRIKSRRSDGTWDWVSEVHQEAQTTTNGNSGHGATMDVFSVDGSAVNGSPVAGKPGDLKKKDLKNTESQKTDTRESSPAPQFSRRDLVITDEMRNWAASVTPLVNIEWESQIFVDHPTGQSQRFNSSESLLGAWRTWMMRGQKYAEQQRTTFQRRSLVDDLNDTSWAEGL
ncbi:hypothetical protein NMR69_002872 [Vibrio cholerae]|uniref:hypothetical protein n=1 Tax=Gammaproteobacteria TaxID=1236 RepID=UPI001159DEB4|nr:hypothetical protein [Vibrio cholerae]EGR1048490.1 hypothetical protein [Vibrio cholerae]EGR4201450.1 hypothetical protein [Vibrio cholerae]EGR4347014.1 hypothetical protein [Vibrio cholerae]EIR1600576.1 hypothetical protein [Vibrio cholerae]EJL6574954.1 hypothetical protein [Vibrio cholerae]